MVLSLILSASDKASAVSIRSNVRGKIHRRRLIWVISSVVIAAAVIGVVVAVQANRNDSSSEQRNQNAALDTPEATTTTTTTTSETSITTATSSEAQGIGSTPATASSSSTSSTVETTSSTTAATGGETEGTTEREWVLQDRLRYNIKMEKTYFGSAVAIYNDTLVARADLGPTQVFVRKNGTWTFLQDLAALGDDGGPQSVAIQDDTIVAGKPSPSAGGGAFVRVREDTATAGEQQEWPTQGEKLETAERDRFEHEDRYGHAVAIDGNTIIVGAPRDGGNVGAVYVFIRTTSTSLSSTWTFQEKLTPPPTSNGSIMQFGKTVAIQDDTIVVGASASNIGGSVFVFTRRGTVWSLQQKLEGSGTSVSIDNDTIVTSAGNVFVRDRQVNVWNEFQQLAYSGNSVAIRGKTIVLGYPFYSTSSWYGKHIGAVFVFVLTDDTWVYQQRITAFDEQSSAYFGLSVALDGETIVVGAPYYDTPDVYSGSIEDQGSVYVYVPK